MADLPVSAASANTLTQNAWGSVQRAQSWTPPDALRFVIDGTEEIRVDIRGEGTRSDSGKVSYDGSSHAVHNAKRLRVSIREADASGGRLVTTDGKFHIPVDAIPTEPTARDSIYTGTAFDERWAILFVDKILHATRYRVYCRRL